MLERSPPSERLRNANNKIARQIDRWGRSSSYSRGWREGGWGWGWSCLTAAALDGDRYIFHQLLKLTRDAGGPVKRSRPRWRLSISTANCPASKSGGRKCRAATSRVSLRVKIQYGDFGLYAVRASRSPQPLIATRCTRLYVSRFAFLDNIFRASRWCQVRRGAAVQLRGSCAVNIDTSNY